jgi:hypothetical protein
MDLVRFLTVGAGTLRPIRSNPTGEPERRKNRRVEMVLNTAPLATANFRERWQACVRSLASVPSEAAPRVSCVCNKLLQSPPPDTKDYYYDARAAEQARAAAGDISQFTPGQLSDFYRSFMPSMGRQIAEIPATSDLDMAAALQAVDDGILRGIRASLRKSVEPNAGAFEHSLAIDVAHRLHDPSHTYSCYANVSLAP